jgi:hypothetical protein
MHTGSSFFLLFHDMGKVGLLYTILSFQNVYGNPAIPFLVERLGRTELIFHDTFAVLLR